MRSFTFFIKEHGILCILFGFTSHTKMTNLAKKERKRTVRFFRVKKNLKFFIAIYIYIYIYNIYISIYIYISVYAYIYL